MSDVLKDFDPIAVVIDWLDACRRRDLAAVLDLYAGEASLECACEGIAIQGRNALEVYWRPRLDAFVPTAFGLEEIEPASDGVVLDYSSYAGKSVRMVFTFSADGKILQTRCVPAASSGGN
jgi:ketosteroid isomerase-like protein